MAISDQLTLLANTKESIRTSINNKGGSVEASAPFASYATAIDNLPSGGGSNADLIDLIERDITSLNIPSGTTKIGYSAFTQCTNLTSVTIPSGVTIIDNSAFSSCILLSGSIVLPQTVTTIGNYAFSNTGITNINLQALSSLGISAFKNCSGLTSIEIPSGITELNGTCEGCTSLQSVTLHEGLQRIHGFRNCSSLTTINVPSTVNYVSNGAFGGCTGLVSIVFNSTTVPTLQASGAFTNTTCSIYVPSASVAAYKAANYWSTLASRIYPITQVATVDGNPVYNYDLGNTDSTTILSTEMAKLPTGTSIEFAEGITNMSGSISGYTTVTLPSTFTTFNDQDMIGSSVTTLTMKSTTPPMAERNKFGGSGLTAIYVPAESVEAYKADSFWSNYASIIQAIPTE